MEIGEVRITEDKDFENLKVLTDCHDGWKQEYNKNPTLVWTKSTDKTSFKMIKLKTIFKEIPPAILFDVLLDPLYRKVWDTHMIESYDVGCINPNNDIGYYAVRCPSPIKNRDFVLHRSWLDTGTEYLIINHSVYHETLPPKKGFIRGVSYLTGFVIRPSGPHGCELGYITQCDPRGSLPSWVINKLTQVFAPKMVKRLRKACLGYETWKSKHNPGHKPWLYPEQMALPKINLAQCVPPKVNGSTESLEETGLEECVLSEKEVNDEDF